MKRVRARQASAAHDGAPGATFQFAGQIYAALILPLPERELRVRARQARLTRSELAVAQKLVAAQSTADIARARRTSRRTVEHQIEAVFRKLGVVSRAELAREICRIHITVKPRRTPSTHCCKQACRQSTHGASH